MSVVHIIGAGLSGLSAAIAFVQAGRKVVIYEQTDVAGGRCRSFYDPVLEHVIDNGSHLLFSGNRSTQRYLQTLGTADTLLPFQAPGFSFWDGKNEDRWTLQWGPMAALSGLFNKNQRIPGTSWLDFLQVGRLFFAKGKTVQSLFGHLGASYERFWIPLTIAALNTPPEHAAAEMLCPLFQETVLAHRAVPLFPKHSLQATFIDPALAWLKDRGATFHFGHHIKKVLFSGGHVTGLTLHGTTTAINRKDIVILAVPAHIAPRLVDGLEAPDCFSPIVNIHYRVPHAVNSPSFLGTLSVRSDWMFQHGSLVSVTLGAAQDLVAEPSDLLSQRIWQEVRRALGLEISPPRARVIKEHRATFLATPDQIARRPASKTPLQNLFLCGEWTQTGLPTTIEGAIRSGDTAAQCALLTS